MQRLRITVSKNGEGRKASAKCNGHELVGLGSTTPEAVGNLLMNFESKTGIMLPKIEKLTALGVGNFAMKFAPVLGIILETR